MTPASAGSSASLRSADAASGGAAASLFGLPSLRSLDAGSSLRIWLCTRRTDMRCGFDRLAALAREVTGQDPLSGHLFVFHNRSGDRLKLLHWDRDGYALWYKRLEAGVFKFPRSAANTASADRTSPGSRSSPGVPGAGRRQEQEPAPQSLELRPSELAMLLDGIDLSSVKRSKRYRRAASTPA